MRRRKNIIISAITCMFSICLMMFGVYAASNPNVSINGQVSYTARDASVLVQGKMYGADGYETVDYKTVTDPTSPTTDDVLTNSVSQYVDYTSADQNKTTLATWNLGDQLKFYEDENGIRKVNVCLKFTNLSNYPVMATAVFESKTATNVKTTQSPTDGKMAMTTIGSVGSDCEMSFVFEVEDDSKNANIDFKLVVTIEKTVLQSYTATFSSGIKQFSNQSNATTYDVAETTVLEEAPELYFEENGGNRRVALWYDNQECQGEPIKFPYVLTSNKTFYSVWEQNTRIFNFFDYGYEQEIEVMFDGHLAIRAESIFSIYFLLDLGDSIGDIAYDVPVDGRSVYVFYPKDISGIRFYNNFLYDTVDEAFYIIPDYDFETLSGMVATITLEQYKQIRKGGYLLAKDNSKGVIELRYISPEAIVAPNIEMFQSNNKIESQVGFDITNNLETMQKYTLTLHANHQTYKFNSVGSSTGFTADATGDTVTGSTAFFSELTSESIHYYNYDVYEMRNVVKWYDNAELEGEPVSLPLFLDGDTELYAKWEQYNRKTYTLDQNAQNIEIWYKGKLILKAKDTSFVPDDISTSTDAWKANVIKDSNGKSLGGMIEFRQADVFDYVDESFKWMVTGLSNFAYYGVDWNPVDFSKLTSNMQIILAYNANDFIIQRDSNNRLTVVAGGDLTFGFNFSPDDLIVYVDGVEANYKLDLTTF